MIMDNYTMDKLWIYGVNYDIIIIIPCILYIINEQIITVLYTTSNLQKPT